MCQYSDDENGNRGAIACVMDGVELVRLECSRERDLVWYAAPHEFVDRRERARLTSCVAFGSDKLDESSIPVTTIVSTT